MFFKTYLKIFMAIQICVTYSIFSSSKDNDLSNIKFVERFEQEGVKVRFNFLEAQNLKGEVLARIRFDNDYNTVCESGDKEIVKQP